MRRLISRGKRVCQVNYEDLIAGTPSVMRRVCDFLKVPHLDSLSTLEGADRSAVFTGQHHANLKGGKIVSGPRPELVGPELLAKVLSYIVFWRGSNSRWPPYPQEVGATVRPPSWSTRLSDRIVYRALRIRDLISPTVTSFVPISLLRRYRERKARRGASSQKIPSRTAGGDEP